MTDSRSTQLKAMKGNDLKVLISMILIASANIGNKDIKMFTGLHYTTVSNCLDNLASMGFVTKTHRTNGWQVTQGGLQMVLPDSASHIFCDSAAIINIDTPLITKGIKDNNNTSPKICDSEILKALFNMGIYNPTAEDLAILDHMTLEYIASWKLALKNNMVPEGRADIPLAIHLMKQGATAPEPKQSDRDKYVKGPYSDMIEH